jgi:hypothetical protein
MTTFLEATNDVLTRLRETSVSSVTQTTYSTLIGKFVNDAKKQVEDAWNWDALSQTLTATMTPGTTTYVLTGSGLRHKDSTVNNITNKNTVFNKSIQWIINQQQLSTVSTGAVVYYAWNGTNGTDSKFEVYPTPNASDVLKFNLYVPQAELSSGSDVLMVPSDAVCMSAYARAIVERGEDGGLPSSEAYLLYKGILADKIAIESSRFCENECWVAT